tara:strand:- start:78 stop:650 length:573 start_codon:yes stop_codon:yes gene_type:complete
MLISHKHKFITIDIPKTGTRTLRESLRPLGVIDVVGQPTQKNFYQHGSINDCERGFKERGWDLENYFKFSIVRNPWERYVSFFVWMKKNHTERAFSMEKIIKNFPSQDSYLFKNGNLAIDMVGQLETMETSFSSFCHKVGIKTPPKLQHLNKSVNKIHYTEYYTDELINLVAAKEKWVIDQFNYNDYKQQ